MTERASPLNATTSPLPSCASPPPKCAICLGNFTNRCFSDSCRHQFCFSCLLEWSKVKAECPLCKQPFKSILHNIKTDEQYDVHIVTPPNVADPRTLLDPEDILFLPPTPSRHFQFRTTFTVDPGGELAIQEMLLSHPLTNNTMYNMHAGGYYHRYSHSRFSRLARSRRASSVTSFRRSIYDLNLWVFVIPELTPYRDISPHFYRDNPAQRNRLVPWLNRELNALLRENTQQVMHLVDVIMEHITRYHIRTRCFYNLLYPYLNDKTEHFVHEFYHFMRSPYDMITYDRQILYIERHQLPTYLISDQEDNDSDVAIVNISEPVTANNNPFQSPRIEVIEINSDTSHDSDVILGEMPEPEIVNLIDSDTTDNEIAPQANNRRESENEVNRKPILPLKVRFKRKRQSRERRSHNSKKSRKRRHRSSSSSSTTSTSTESETSKSSDSSSSASSYYRKYKRRQKYKKMKRSKSHKSRASHNREKYKIQTLFSARRCNTVDLSSDEEPTTPRTNPSTYDSDDDLPLSRIRKGLTSNSNGNYATNSDEPISSNHTISSSSQDVSHSSICEDIEPRPSCSLWNRKPKVENLNNSPTSSYSPLRTYSDEIIPSFSSSDLSDSDRNRSCKNFGNRNSTYYNVSTYNNSTPTIGNRYYDGPDFKNHLLPNSFSKEIKQPSAVASTSSGVGECQSITSNDFDSSLNRDSVTLPIDYSRQERKPFNLPEVGCSLIKNEVSENDYVDKILFVKREDQNSYNCSYIPPSDCSDD